MSIIARDDDFPIFMVGTNSPAKRTLLFRRVLGHTVLNQFEILLKEDDFNLITILILFGLSVAREDDFPILMVLKNFQWIFNGCNLIDIQCPLNPTSPAIIAAQSSSHTFLLFRHK